MFNKVASIRFFKPPPDVYSVLKAELGVIVRQEVTNGSVVPSDYDRVRLGLQQRGGTRLSSYTKSYYFNPK